MTDSGKFFPPDHKDRGIIIIGAGSTREYPDGMVVTKQDYLDAITILDRGHSPAEQRQRMFQEIPNPLPLFADPIIDLTPLQKENFKQLAEQGRKAQKAFKKNKDNRKKKPKKTHRK